MTYERFEDLPAWKAAMQLGDQIAQLLEHDYFHARRGLADQLDRAAISVSNNIAEGFERGTTPNLINFLGHAKGSAGEVRSMLHGLAKRASSANSPIQDSKSKIQELAKDAEAVSRQLEGWLGYLKDTELKGARHMNTQAREQDDRARNRAAFLRMLEEQHPIPKDATFQPRPQ